jgi:hypothetical protein
MIKLFPFTPLFAPSRRGFSQWPGACPSENLVSESYSDRTPLSRQEITSSQAAAWVVPSPCRFITGASHSVAAGTTQRQFGAITLEGYLMLHEHAEIISQGKTLRLQCPVLEVGSSDRTRRTSATAGVLGRVENSRCYDRSPSNPHCNTADQLSFRDVIVEPGKKYGQAGTPNSQDATNFLFTSNDVILSVRDTVGFSRPAPCSCVVPFHFVDSHR